MFRRIFFSNNMKRRGLYRERSCTFHVKLNNERVVARNKVIWQKKKEIFRFKFRFVRKFFKNYLRANKNLVILSPIVSDGPLYGKQLGYYFGPLFGGRAVYFVRERATLSISTLAPVARTRIVPKWTSCGG